VRGERAPETQGSGIERLIQVAGVSIPSRRISGWVRRWYCFGINRDRSTSLGSRTIWFFL
jgi:hypothetical protein